MCAPPPQATRRGAFTLVELVVVILVIGVLAGVAAPKLLSTTTATDATAFAQELMVLTEAIDRYYLDQGDLPPDSDSGRLPDELQPYASQRQWEGETPLGGAWDSESNDNGVTLAMGVVYRDDSIPVDALRLVDELIDDGDLNAGAFREITSRRYYYVLEE